MRRKETIEENKEREFRVLKDNTNFVRDCLGTISFILLGLDKIENGVLAPIKKNEADLEIKENIIWCFDYILQKQHHKLTKMLSVSNHLFLHEKDTIRVNRKILKEIWTLVDSFKEKTFDSDKRMISLK